MSALSPRACRAQYALRLETHRRAAWRALHDSAEGVHERRDLADTLAERIRLQ
jgi:hypothetical protein